jgi:hypothetical protein
LVVDLYVASYGNASNVEQHVIKLPREDNRSIEYAEPLDGHARKNARGNGRHRPQNVEYHPSYCDQKKSHFVRLIAETTPMDGAILR